MSAAIEPVDEPHLPVEERFAVALNDQWYRVGQPTKPQMAKKANVPLKNFPDVARDPHLLPWSAVRVYLRGLGVKPKELEHWSDFWAKASATEERPSGVAERATPKTPKSSSRQNPRPHEPAELNELAVAAAKARSAKEYLGLLDELRRVNGLSYAQVGRAGGKGMSRSTVHTMLGGDRLPTKRQVQVFLKICRVSPLETQAWLQALSRLAENTLSGVHLRVVPEPPPTKPSPGRPAEPQQSMPWAKTAAPRETAAVPPPDTLSPPPAGVVEQLGLGREPDPDGTQTILYSVTAPDGETRWVFRRINDSKRERATFTLWELFGAAIVTMILTGCAISMWLLRLPLELIVTVYITIGLLLGAWILSEKTAPFRKKLNARYTARYLLLSDEIFDDPRMVAPPTIGG